MYIVQCTTYNIWIGDTTVQWYVDTVSHSNTPVHQYIGIKTTFNIFLVKQLFGPFRFASIFSLHSAYFPIVFASDFYFCALLRNEISYLFLLQSESIFAIQFSFSIRKRKRGLILNGTKWYRTSNLNDWDPIKINL